MSRLPRKYQAIWNEIKTKGKCTVETHPLWFPRVKKAVIKEKDEDKGFKVLNDHDKFRLDIVMDVENGKITFTLEQKFGIEGVKVG